jgi:hypothetical protein
MKRLLGLAYFITFISLSSAYAATQTKFAKESSEDDFFRIGVGHQSIQFITLRQRMIKETQVFTLAFKNDEGLVVEQAIPKSAYNQTKKSFSELEKTFLRNNLNALNYKCSSSLSIMTTKESHSFCRSMLSPQQNKDVDQWFLATKELLLGKTRLK